jgi:hypothetical protein
MGTEEAWAYPDLTGSRAIQVRPDPAPIDTTIIRSMIRGNAKGLSVQ